MMGSKIKLSFKNKQDAQAFVAEIFKAQNSSQLRYEYDKARVVELWWQYETGKNSSVRYDEEEEALESINSLFYFLEENDICWEFIQA